MNNWDGMNNSTACLTLLSRLLLCADRNAGSDLSAGQTSTHDCVQKILRDPAGLARSDFGELWSLATSHHVIMRAFPGLHRAMLADGNDRAAWVDQAMAKEQTRIEHALSFLSPICSALGDIGDIIVIKSLDHWPDLGSDLDLYSNAQSVDVIALMRARFNAQVALRSWGDRLANKWNFIVPGLPELVEVHIGRLGQTGEQVAITNSLVSNAGAARFGSYTFRVPAAEDRLILSALQRMYRHFYLRLCDIVDTARLVESDAIDYMRLCSLAHSAGLWDGLATYLVTVSGYVKSFNGRELRLPSLVKRAAKFGSEEIQFRGRFFRVPIFPHAAGFYLAEWKRLLLNGELQNLLRLSVLPGLAGAAVLELKITGSDKGIW